MGDRGAGDTRCAMRHHVSRRSIEPTYQADISKDNKADFASLHLATYSRPDGAECGRARVGGPGLAGADRHTCAPFPRRTPGV